MPWLLLAAPVAAQPAGAWTLQGGLGFSTTTMRPEAPAMLPDAGLGLHLFMEPRFYNVLAFRIETGLSFLSPLCFGDDADCSVLDAEEDAFFLLSGALATGLFSPRISLGSEAPRLRAGLVAGREWGTAWRGTRQCLNCMVDGVALRAGFFAEPVLELYLAPRLGLGIGYRTYLAPSDLRGRLSLRFFSTTR